MHISLVRVYLNALFSLARHGNTFAAEANAAINELSAPEVQASDYFGAIDKAPHSPFESCLKQTARAMFTQDR